MKLPSPRRLFLIGFLYCLFVLSMAIYLQAGMGLNPCPLCQLQRIFIGVTGFLYLLAFLNNPYRKGIKVYSAVIFIAALFGLITAGFQVWLQWNPPAASDMSCGATLSYLISALSLKDAVGAVIHGTGNCAEIQMTLLGMSVPMWSFLGFLFLCALCVVQYKRVKDH